MALIQVVGGGVSSVFSRARNASCPRNKKEGSVFQTVGYFCLHVLLRNNVSFFSFYKNSGYHKNYYYH